MSLSKDCDPKQTKPIKRRPTRFNEAAIENLIGIQARLVSKRKVREIVTVSGRGVRGYFPSRKGKLLKFESLGEEDVLRVFEVASVVGKLVTQPCVLELGSEHECLRYTPDVLATINGQNHFIEVKAENFHKDSDTVSRLRKIVKLMRSEHVSFILIVANEVRVAGLQDELKDILSKRPRPGRFDPDIDPALWDPLKRESADVELIARWDSAQKECDALIQRAMRRDPDSLLEAIS